MQNEALVHTMNTLDFLFLCLTTMCAFLAVRRLAQYICNQKIALPNRLTSDSIPEPEGNCAHAQHWPPYLSSAPDLATTGDMENSPISNPFAITQRNRADTDSDTDSGVWYTKSVEANATKYPEEKSEDLPKNLSSGVDGEDMDPSSSTVASTADTRVRHESIKASLSDEERLEDQRIRSEQLARIHSLMQSQPDLFGSISIADMHLQMNRFYTDEKLVPEHSV